MHSSAQPHDMCTPCTNPGWHKPSQSAVPLPPPDHRPAAQRFWLESVEPAAHQAPGSHTPLQLDVGRAEVAPYLVHDMEVRTWYKRPTRPCHSHAATRSHTQPHTATHSHTQPHTATRSHTRPHTVQEGTVQNTLVSRGPWCCRIFQQGTATVNHPSSSDPTDTPPVSSSALADTLVRPGRNSAQQAEARGRWSLLDRRKTATCTRRRLASA